MFSLCLCFVAQSCPSLCNPLLSSPPGSSVHGIFQARLLEWLALLLSRGSSQSRDGTHVSFISCTGRWILYHCATRSSIKMEIKMASCVCVLVTQSCLTLCDPMDCSPPGFSVHGILQERILEWVAMPSSGDLPNPGIKSHLLSLLH